MASQLSPNFRQTQASFPHGLLKFSMGNSSILMNPMSRPGFFSYGLCQNPALFSDLILEFPTKTVQKKIKNNLWWLSMIRSDNVIIGLTRVVSEVWTPFPQQNVTNFLVRQSKIAFVFCSFNAMALAVDREQDQISSMAGANFWTRNIIVVLCKKDLLLTAY